MPSAQRFESDAATGRIALQVRQPGWPNRLINEYVCVAFCLAYAAGVAWLITQIFTRTGSLSPFALFFIAAFGVMALTNSFNLFTALGSLLNPMPRHRRMYRPVPLEPGVTKTVGLLVCTRNEEGPYEKLNEVADNLLLNAPADPALRNRYRFIISLLTDSSETTGPDEPNYLDDDREAVARVKAERPEHEWRFCRRKDVGAYGKYGNMFSWLRSPNADETDYYICYDYDSKMTGGCVWALLTELESYPELFSVQGTMAIESQEGMSRFAIDTAQARDEFSCTALVAILGGNWGHQLAVRTDRMQAMLRQFPPEQYSEAEVLSHDCLEALWASTIGWESGIIEVAPEDSLEQTCEDVTELIVRGVRWQYGTIKWIKQLFVHLFRASLSIQLFSWVAIFSFVNQLLLVLVTVIAVLFFDRLQGLFSSTHTRHIEGVGDVPLHSWKPAIVLSITVVSLLADRFVALWPRRVVDIPNQIVRFGKGLLFSIATGPVQSFMLGIALARMIITDRRVGWKPMKKTIGQAPGLLAYVKQLWIPATAGLALTIYVLANEMSVLYIFVLPYTVSLAVSPWVQYYLARPPTSGNIRAGATIADNVVEMARPEAASSATSP